MKIIALVGLFLTKMRAKMGHAESMFKLGKMHHFGQGAKASEKEALIWYKKAAGAGNVKALNNIGVILEDQGWSGHVDEDSDRNPLKWLRKGAELGDPAAMYNLARCLDDGWWTTAPATDSDDFDLWVEQNNQVVFKWYSKAADLGVVPAMCSLGYIYLRGWGVPQSDASAAHWFSLAAASGDQVALKELNALKRKKP